MRLDETYPVLRDCWIAGGQAAQVAPEEWQPLLDADPDESERRLLALAGQAFEVGMRPDLGPHTARPPLPVLARPPVPARLRPLVRRVLQAERTPGSGGSPRRVVALLDRRGFTVNPVDWFPSAGADVPEVYRPWQAWTANSADPDPGTSVDDWDLLTRPARRRLLRRLRATDPAAARQLLDDRFRGEPAAERSALLEVVAQTDLSDDDVPFLQSLARDRSAAVTRLALRLLARTGAVSADPDDVTELCGFLAVSRKKLSRRVTVSAPAVKTAAQGRRRDELFETVSLAELATGLGISADELVTAWTCTASQDAATRALVTMVVATGTQPQAELLATRLVAQEEPGLAAPLRPRMRPAAVAELVSTVLDQGIGATHSWCHDATDPAQIAPGALGSAAFSQLCEKDSATPAEVHAANTLALLCPPDVAARAVERLRAAGVAPQYLDLFVLSAELRPPEGA